MSSVVGAVNVSTNSGTFNVGDTLRIAPQRIEKTFVGQGHSNTGLNVSTYNKNNTTNVKPST